MENLFNYGDYKDFIRKTLESGARGMQSQLARHLGCQSAYLYQTLKSSGNLTEDQAYKVTTFLELSENERDYFLLLVRLAKAGTPELRAFLQAEAKRSQEAEKDLKNKADSEVAPEQNQAWDYYFSSTLPSAIHLLTSSTNFQTIEAIAAKLSVDAKTARLHLGKLQALGFVALKEKKWKHQSPSFHFPKNSKHNLAMQTMRRSQALSSLLRDSGPEHIQFSTLFTLDKKSLEKLNALIGKFVQDAQKVVHQGGTDDLYVLALDLFPPYLDR